ncbi:hypothetical protein [Nitrosophilus alvini]|uniref:hypothetical protein n=1 Tax=Nitrosophilus alvini TaxID=2714855 RepID=UPI00190B1863|nr:hypothetical protein [Nitrosophilus alvini]
MRYLFLLIFCIPIFASNILSIDVKEHKDNIEILFGFDTPYEGQISQKVAKEQIKIILKDAKSPSSWQKKIDTSFVYQIELIPKGNDSELIIYTVEKAAVLASKSTDGFGLKLLVKKLSTQTSKSIQISENSSSFNFENILKTVLGGIAIIAIFGTLFYLLTRREKSVRKKSMWVIDQNRPDIDVRYEKKLDEHNKIALISYKGTNYLVIIGNSNILLGKYSDEEVEKDEDFENIVSENKEEVEAFLNKNDKEFEAYKEKASK